MLAKPWRGKYKLVGEDMAISVAAQELGAGTYVPQHPTQILSLWGSQPKFGLQYGTNEAAISISPDNLNRMRQALVEIYADGWRLLLEENPAYLKEVLSVLELPSASSEDDSLTKIFKAAVKNFLPILRQKPPIFLGERSIAPHVRNLFGLQAEDFHVLEDEHNRITLSTAEAC